LKQITYQALYAEKNPTSSNDRTKWWNLFNISEFVSEFEPKASSSITNRHEKLQSQQNKIKETELIITEGAPRKRTIEQLIASFDSITNKRHKKDIFERTLSIVVERSSADNNTDFISQAEVERYKNIMQASSTKSNSKVDQSNPSSSDEDSASSSDSSQL